MPKCKACDDKFVWNDDVVIVDDECYHKDCLTLVPMGFYALLDGEPLGETENDEGDMACEIFDELILRD